MADATWRDTLLSKGQVDQLLIGKRCKKIKTISEDASMWEAPTGDPFTISYANCDAGYVEKIVAQLEKWANSKLV